MSNDQPSARQELRDGFLATMLLWPGAIPFAIAFALLAQTNGFSKVETVSMSLFIFA